MQGNGQVERIVEDYDTFGFNHGRSSAMMVSPDRKGEANLAKGNYYEGHGTINRAGSPQFFMNQGWKTVGASEKQTEQGKQNDNEYVYDDEPVQDFDDMSSVTSATSNASTISSSHLSKHSRTLKPMVRLEMALEGEGCEEGSLQNILRRASSESTPRAGGRLIQSRRSRDVDLPIPLTVSSSSATNSRQTHNSTGSAKSNNSNSKIKRKNTHRKNELQVRNQLRSWLHLLIEVNYAPDERPYRHNDIEPDEPLSGNHHVYYSSDEDPDVDEEGKQTELDVQLSSLLSLLKSANQNTTTADAKSASPSNRNRYKKLIKESDAPNDDLGASGLADDNSDSDISSEYLKPLPTLSDTARSPRGPDTNPVSKSQTEPTEDATDAEDLQLYPSVESSGTDLSAMYKDALGWSKSSSPGSKAQDPSKKEVMIVSTGTHDKDGASRSLNLNERTKMDDRDNNEKKDIECKIQASSPNAACNISNMLDAFDSELEESTKKGYYSSTSDIEEDCSRPVATRLLINFSSSSEADIENAPPATNETSSPKKGGRLEPLHVPSKTLNADFNKDINNGGKEMKPKASRSLMSTVLGTKDGHTKGETLANRHAKHNSSENILPPRPHHRQSSHTDTEIDETDDDSDVRSGKSVKSARSSKSSKSVLSRMSAQGWGIKVHKPPAHPVRRSSFSESMSKSDFEGLGLPRPERLEDSDEEISVYSFGSNPSKKGKKRWVFKGGRSDGGSVKGGSVSGTESGTEAGLKSAASQQNARNKGIVKMPALPLVRSSSKNSKSDRATDTMLLTAEDDTEEVSGNWNLDPFAPNNSSATEPTATDSTLSSLIMKTTNQRNAKEMHSIQATGTSGSLPVLQEPASHGSTSPNRKNNKSTAGVLPVMKNITPFRKRQGKKDELKEIRKKEAKLQSSSSFGERETAPKNYGKKTLDWTELDVPAVPAQADNSSPTKLRADSPSSFQPVNSQPNPHRRKTTAKPTLIDRDGFLLDGSLPTPTRNNITTEHAFDATFGQSEDDFWGSTPLMKNFGDFAAFSPDGKSSSLFNNDGIPQTEREAAVRERAKEIFHSKLSSMSPSAFADMQFGEDQSGVTFSTNKSCDTGSLSSERPRKMTGSKKPQSPLLPNHDPFHDEVSPTLSASKSILSSRSQNAHRRMERHERKYKIGSAKTDLSDATSIDSGKSGNSMYLNDHKLKKQLTDENQQQNIEAQRADAVEAATKRRIEALRKMIAERSEQNGLGASDTATENLKKQLDMIERETLKKINKVRESKSIQASVEVGKIGASERDSTTHYGRVPRSSKIHDFASRSIKPTPEEV